MTLAGNGELNLDANSLEAGACTFTTQSGKKFTSIVITAYECGFNGTGWSNNPSEGASISTWSGSSTSVSFSGMGYNISSIVFTLEDE